MEDFATVSDAPELIITLDDRPVGVLGTPGRPALPNGMPLRSSAATVVLGPRGLVGASGWQLAAKRTIDVFGSLTLLVVLAPVLTVVALAVLVTSRGGALYRQERCGERGRPFTMWKFRSMYRDAEARLAQLVDHNQGTGPVFKMRDDPRVTPVGRILRKCSLDELPQLVNVLRGDMSLVGPRPPLPREVAHYTPRDRSRLAVKPGITCTWQVCGRSEVDFASWVDMDLEYIANWSLGLDLKLLLLTVPAVLSGRGAY